MEKIIRFKKNWEESYIRVNMIDGSVIELDTPLYTFIKRFKELLKVPNVRWKTSKKADEAIRTAVLDAFDKTINEMKEETKRV
jgi:hypothetical protein